MNKLVYKDKKKLLRQQDHLTTPPRLEGAVKNAKMNPTKKRRFDSIDGSRVSFRCEHSRPAPSGPAFLTSITFLPK